MTIDEAIEASEMTHLDDTHEGDRFAAIRALHADTVAEVELLREELARATATPPVDPFVRKAGEHETGTQAESELHDAIVAAVPPDQLEWWMKTANPTFGNRAPEALIAEGDHGPLWKALYRLGDKAA